MINKETDISEFERARKRQAVHTVNQFCLNEIDCRRMLLLNHFAEKFDPAFCKGTCDNCASTDEVTEIDLTNSAIQFVKLIQEAENRHMKITGPQSIHAFRGTSKGEMTRRAFDTLDHFAKGSDLSTDLSKRLFDHLVAREILTTELEDAPLPNRAPISYVYVLTFFFTSAMLRLTRPLVAWAQGKGVSREQATLHLGGSLRKERDRHNEVKEGLTTAGRSTNSDQEDAYTVGGCGRPCGAVLSHRY